MTWIGLVLGGIGIVDLVRPDPMRFDARSSAACLLAGALTGAVLLLGGVGPWLTLAMLTGVMLAGACWAALATWSLRDGRSSWVGVIGAVAVVGAPLVASPYSPELGGLLGRWYAGIPLDMVHDVPVDRAVSVVGCALFLIGSGNVIVRLVLTGAGSSVARNEQQIKGGRVLGPMERLLIFGLGLAGDLEAASIIVAAKGLLRFPELQSYRREEGMSEEMPGQRIDALTEYFLIGSLASWMLALVAVALA